MVDRFGVHRSNQRDIVGDAADIWKHAAQSHAALAVALEWLDGGQARPLGVATGHGR